jgi:hypothetical protein
MNRRDFLLFTGGLLLAANPLTRAFAHQAGSRLVSCRTDADGVHHLTAVGIDGSLHFDVVLPGRGHGICVRPDGSQAVVFARRPDDFLWVVDVDSGRVLQQKTSQPGRHYFGHGVFDPAGRLLYVTENAYDEGHGVVGIYDAADGYRRLGEIPSHGVGPHELKLLADGRTLVIANGGIHTHPDSERSKLNLDDMDPSLAYVDTASGLLLGQYRPPAQWHQLSIRHLDVTPDDKVCIAMQYEGPVNQHPPLIAVHQGEASLRLLSAPDEVQQRMRNYCGSVACDLGGEVFAVSSPRGNLITLWSAADGRLLDAIAYADGCGLARTDGSGRFYASNGQGDLMQLGRAAAGAPGHAWNGWRWDNHLVAF